MPIIKASWLSNCLTSPPFFPLLFSFWWAALSQLSGLLQLWIIHVTRHYLDGVNNWNLCLKGFDVDERKGSSGRAGGRLWARVPGCQAGDTSHVNRFWLTSPDGRPSLLGGRRLWLESEPEQVWTCAVTQTQYQSCSGLSSCLQGLCFLACPATTHCAVLHVFFFLTAHSLFFPLISFHFCSFSFPLWSFPFFQVFFFI